MTSGDLITVNLRFKVSRAAPNIPSTFLLAATGIDISLFTIAGIEKSRFTGDELAEYIITLVEI